MALIEVPDAILPLFESVLDHVRNCSERGLAGGAVNFAEDEKELMGRVAAFELSCIKQILQSLDPLAPRIEVDGRSYRRMNNETMDGTYFAMRGAITFRRGLYRDEQTRNGSTVVPMELRAGIVEGHLTPAAALGFAAMGQGVPSREAEKMCSMLGVLPYSRSEHFRSAADIGEKWGQIRDIGEEMLVEQMEIPKSTSAVSVAVDRVSLPMAEPRPLTAEDAKRGVTFPISVVFRMAYSAVITLYDDAGMPSGCVRYAHVPTDGAIVIEDALRNDISTILKRAPEVSLVTLADGAPEMQDILDRATSNLIVDSKLIDFWHVMEKLGEAISSVRRRNPEETLSRFRQMLLSDDGAVDEIEVELRTWSARYKKPENIPEKLQSAITYLSNNKARMRYAANYASGLPIGSGTVEATGKTIVETRMRRAGARWEEDGAQAILDLRALFTSTGKRWTEAMNQVINSYKAAVTPLPPRVKRVKTNPSR